MEMSNLKSGVADYKYEVISRKGAKSQSRKVTNKNKGNFDVSYSDSAMPKI
jgi:hypothetical protein